MADAEAMIEAIMQAAMTGNVAVQAVEVTRTGRHQAKKASKDEQTHKEATCLWLECHRQACRIQELLVRGK